MKNMESVINNKDGTLTGSDDMVKYPVQTLGAYLPFLKGRFSDHIDPNITFDENIDTIHMGN